MPYSSIFADYYDQLTGNISYRERAEYFDRLIKQYGTRPGILLDLACGTGSLSVEFARRGYDVIGVDSSEDMLSFALEKNSGLSRPILFLCQDMAELDLYGTVDVTVSALDSINHILEEETLRKVFEKVSLFMNPGGLFLFDVNTPYKHREVLGENTFVYELENLFCVWQNSYDPEGERVDISLDLFQEKGRLYERYSEDFSERAYPEEILTELLNDSGFEILGIYADGSMEAVTDRTERAVYLARKR